MSMEKETGLKGHLTEEEQQRRREGVEATLATHMIEGIYPTEKTKRVFEGYIEGRYDMDDVIEILIEKN